MEFFPLVVNKNQEDIESLTPKFITKELTGATVESGTAIFYFALTNSKGKIR